MTYAFTFDARACSGCKACQEACKDKNQLPLGILWRRVIEVSGGSWQKNGAAWESSVFAYNLALACNHCTHPKCAGVCPTDAYTVHPDGIVLLDDSRCMGCGYCAWACPYGAPQYDMQRGVMTKCDFCYEQVEAGLPPTCVAACPLRVLSYASLEQLEIEACNQNLWQLSGSQHPFPLPKTSRTEPHLAIKPHPGMQNPLEKNVSNPEEILPPLSIDYLNGFPARHELPLVGFTLLAQMAVGLALGNLLNTLPIQGLLAIGFLLAVGGLVSFLHLGKKRNAWRAVTHLRKSWLSREILLAGLFGITWAVTAGMAWVWQASPSPWPMVLMGCSLVYCMARVYRLRAVPSWNTWRTPAAFYLTTLSLGFLSARLFVQDARLLAIAGFSLVAELAMLLISLPKTGSVAYLRLGLLGLGIMGTLAVTFGRQLDGLWIVLPVFIFVLVQEAVGRWQFYARRAPFPLDSR